MRAHRLGVPPPLIRLCFNACMSLRLARLGKRYMVVGYGDCGLPAGCGMSFLWISVYSIEAYDTFTSLFPKLDLDVYVDDIVISI